VGTITWEPHRRCTSGRQQGPKTHIWVEDDERRELRAFACQNEGKPTVRGAYGSADGEDERSECPGKSGVIWVDSKPLENITHAVRRLTFVWCFDAREFEKPFKHSVAVSYGARGRKADGNCPLDSLCAYPP
jgi:hypothetical protein